MKSLALLLLLSLAARAQSHSVALQWNASTSEGVVGYKVYRGTARGGPYAYLSTSDTTSASDATVASGLYCYVVTAVTADAESASSNESCAMVSGSQTGGKVKKGGKGRK